MIDFGRWMTRQAGTIPEPQSGAIAKPEPDSIYPTYHAQCQSCGKWDDVTEFVTDDLKIKPENGESEVELQDFKWWCQRSYRCTP